MKEDSNEHERSGRMGGHRYLFRILTVFAVLAALSVTAVLAESDEVSAEPGDVGYTFTDGAFKYVVTAANEVEVTGYTEPLQAHLSFSTVENGDITYTVRSIGDQVFQEREEIISVDLGQIRAIGLQTFLECTNLTTIDLSSVQTLGRYAFRGCTGLSSHIDLGSIQTLGGAEFMGCTSITTVDLGQMQTVSSGMFSGCIGITSIDLGQVRTIEDTAFGETGLTSVDLSQVETVGKYAFWYSADLRSVDLGSIQTINDYVFSDCTNLTTIDLSSVQTIGNNAFTRAGLTSLNIDSIQTIGEYTFEGCADLTSVNIGSAQTIGRYAFHNNSLTSLNIDSIQTIGESAFSRCADLTSVNIGSAQTISREAFVYCDNLTSVNIGSAQTIGVDAFIECPSLTTVDLGQTETVSGGAFMYCNNLTTVDLSQVKNIGRNAFPDNRITTVDLSQTETLGENAFIGCMALESVTHLDSVKSFGNDVFAHTPLADINISSSSFSLAGNSFGQMPNLRTVTVPSDLASPDAEITANAPNSPGLSVFRYDVSRVQVLVESSDDGTVTLRPADGSPVSMSVTNTTLDRNEPLQRISGTEYLSGVDDSTSYFISAALEYEVTIHGGTSDIPYGVEDTTVTLKPGAAPAGKEFSHWMVVSGDADVVGNILTIGTSHVEVIAVWANIPPHTVTFVSGDGYTMVPVSPSNEVKDGGSYSFKCTPNEGYDITTMVVAANGRVLSPDVNGIYTITDITDDVSVSVKVSKLTYDVYLPEGDGYAAGPSSGHSLIVEHGDHFEFSVISDPGREHEVWANGVLLEKREDGTYRIEDMTGPVDITVRDKEGDGGGMSTMLILAVLIAALPIFFLFFILYRRRKEEEEEEEP